jgi:hypothetical protein
LDQSHGSNTIYIPLILEPHYQLQKNSDTSGSNYCYDQQKTAQIPGQYFQNLVEMMEWKKQLRLGESWKYVCHFE